MGQLINMSNPSCLLHALMVEDKTQLSPEVLKDARFILLQKAIGDPVSSPDVTEAYRIYHDDNKRLIINAFLFASCPVEEISEVLKVKKEVLEYYSTLMFDLSRFKTELDKFSFINACAEKEKEAYQYALKFGKDFIKWKICGLPLKLEDMRDQLIEMFTLSKYKANIAAMSGITQESSKEALKWLTQSVKIAEVISKHDTEKEASKSQDINPDDMSSMYNTDSVLGVLVRLKSNNSVKSTSEIETEIT